MKDGEGVAMFFDANAFWGWFFSLAHLEAAAKGFLSGAIVGLAIHRFYLDSLAVWLFSRCRERLRRFLQS